MRQKSGPVKEPAVKVVKDIPAATRAILAAEKIRMVLEGLRGEESIAELCRREGIVQKLSCRWSKDSLRPGRSGSSAGEALWRLLLARQRAGNQLAAVE